MTRCPLHILHALCAALVLSLSACSFGGQEFAHFDPIDPSSVSARCFMPTAMSYTQVDRDLPADTYVLGGQTASEFVADAAQALPDSVPQDSALRGPLRTTSTDPATIIQQLASWGWQKSLVQISGVYTSVDAEGNPLLLSGKVIMPSDGHFRRYILVSHYTIGANREAPYNCFSLEGVLAKMGYAVVLPDYLGYGVTADRIHPYLMMDLTAIHVTDMLFAVREYMEAQGILPEYDDVYLMGYSQGGATTMAVQRYIEDFLPDDAIRIRRVFAGGGPYDVRATYQRFVSTNEASYPVAVPLVVQGMIEGAGLSITCREMLSERVYRNLDNWINSKQYTTGQINRAIGTNRTDALLSEVSLDVTSPQVAELYKAMTRNSVVSYAWTPQAPVYIMHSIDDDTVPYENATLAKARWANSNIEYNFGHYGNHIMTCLRFVSAVQSLLSEEQDREDRQHS